MIETKSRVVIEKSPVDEIARIIKEKGYSIADSAHERVEHPGESSIGILKDREPIRKGLSGLFGIKSSRRALLIAEIYFKREVPLTSYTNEWSAYISNQHDRDEVLPILRELTEKFGAQVNVETGHEIRYEIYPHDLDF